MRLIFEAEGESWPLRLGTGAPETTAALLAALPMPLQLHTPKIAGSHVYWHAPFVRDVEGATHVLDAAPGAFIYWPVRQFLEITFAPLQAETAAVTVLGHLDAPIEGIAALAAVLRRDQGRRTLTGTLRREDGGTAPAAATTAPEALVALRRGLWSGCPADVAALTGSRAIMHPAGPVFMAESEARVLHEALWWVRAKLGGAPEAQLRAIAALALDHAGVRLRDFCHFDTSAEALFAFRDAMAGPAPIAALLDEAIMAAGRLAAWIDLLIPWNDVNEAFRAALGQEEQTA
ncbi:MAG: hypothetical protein R3D63_14400 [Paracoccaceae bacterium]